MDLLDKLKARFGQPRVAAQLPQVLTNETRAECPFCHQWRGMLVKYPQAEGDCLPIAVRDTDAQIDIERALRDYESGLARAFGELMGGRRD